jgi:hypothetical protein
MSPEPFKAMPKLMGRPVNRENTRLRDIEAGTVWTVGGKK